MGAFARFLVAAAAPLMLGGCLWGPGKFTSDLAIRKDGSFTLDYRGEILFQLPDKAAEATPWENGFARCYKDGRAERFGVKVDGDPDPEERDCTAAELAKMKAEHDKEQAERVETKRKENEEMAKMFGIPGMDDEGSRQFAARLMKYQGWNSVSYKGKGVYDVVYHYDGRAGQDYAFPMMPDSDMIIPFIVLRQRTDGSVQVTAPALVGGQGALAARAAMQGLPNTKGGDGPVSRAEGRFTVTVQGDILTNNSEDGPVATPAGKQVHWDVTARSNRIPEMLVRAR